MKTFKITFCLLLLMSLWCCQKEDKHTPFNNDPTPPGKVLHATVENLKGEARITYSLPKDSNLLYVKAVYQIRPGVTREVKVSYYTNNLIVDGFRDTTTTEVKLYTVSNSEVASEPITVMVSPKKPAYLTVFDSLKVLPDFGGINIKSSNPDKKAVGIIVLLKDQYGKWQQYNAHYSSANIINRSFRGMDTLEKQFGFYIRDQFQNISDTMFANIKPWYETKLDKSKFREYILPGDVPVNAYGRVMSYLWDEGYAGWGSAICTYEVLTDTVKGAYFTWDLGQTAKLSRFTWWHYADPLYFDKASIKCYEIWGSTNPNPDGSWNSWFKLADVNQSKPSGLPVGTENSDDVAMGKQGWETTFDISMPPVRYLRLKHKYNWQNRQTLTANEVSVWGKPIP